MGKLRWTSAIAAAWISVAAGAATGCWQDPAGSRNVSELAAGDDHTVLILATTVAGGLGSREAVLASAAGYSVEIATPAQWAAKTASDFASYRAIVLGDPNCGSVSAVAAAVANRTTWGPAITGNVILVGTDPALHRNQGGDAVTQGSIAFAANEPGQTGAYISLSCYYTTSNNTPVPLLEPFESGSTGVFRVRQVGCFNNAHKVAAHPALAGVTDMTLSNWNCSVHEAFTSFPSNFLPLAIARNATGDGILTFPDGSVGVPYIMARGRDLVPPLCGDGVVQPSEQCDDGNTNNCDGCSAQCRVETPVCGDGRLDCGEVCDDGNTTGGDGCSPTCQPERCGNGALDPGEECDDGNTSDGDGCSATCRLQLCGNGVLDPEEQCDDGNTSNGDGCSQFCTIENAPPVARCADRTVIADGNCQGSASIDDGSTDDSGSFVCEQAPPPPYELGSTPATLTCTDGAGASASCTATVQVIDRTPPEISCPEDQTLECVGGGAVATYAASASDNCAAVTPSCDPPSGSVFEVGTSAATCTANDGAGGEASCGFQVTVVDTQRPVVVTDPDTGSLWPPNHKYRSFDVAECITSIVDACEGPIDVADAAIQIRRVTSDEAEDDKLGDHGQGDGDTCNDIVLTGPRTADLRVERMGRSNGRVYTVYFDVSDRQGNVTSASCRVGVPHDQAPPSAPVDDGCGYCEGADCGTCPGHDPSCTY
jgi:cysteine-rich repeat protein